MSRALVRLRTRPDSSDALHDWTKTIGPSIWAIPGGFPADGWLAQGLFDA